jgi:hypothetical protein
MLAGVMRTWSLAVGALVACCLLLVLARAGRASGGPNRGAAVEDGARGRDGAWIGT